MFYRLKNPEASIKFYSFSKKHPEQTEKWIIAINRLGDGKKMWQPTLSARICSEHFLGNQKSFDPDSPSFVPTIFPTNHRKQLCDQDLARYERRTQRHIRIKETTEALNSEQSTHSEQIVKSDEVLRLEEASIVEGEVREDCLVFPNTQSKTIHHVMREENEKPNFLESPLKISMEYATQTPKSWQEKEETSKKRKLSRETKKVAKTNQKTQTEQVKLVSKTTMTQESVLHNEVLMLSNYSERQYRAFCGIPRRMFRLLLSKCERQCKTSRSLSISDKINIVLIKLKLNLSYDVIGGLFNVR